MRKQLRYAGVLDVVRVRRNGYALRRTPAAFLQQYSALVPSEHGDARRMALKKQRELCALVLGRAGPPAQVLPPLSFASLATPSTAKNKC